MCLAGTLWLEVPYQRVVGDEIILGYHALGTSVLGWYFIFLIVVQILHLYYLIMDRRKAGLG